MNRIIPKSNGRSNINKENNRSKLNSNLYIKKNGIKNKLFN